MSRAHLDAQRALFEAWLREFWTQGYEARKTADGVYQNAAAQNYWVCWQATLASQAQAVQQDSLSRQLELVRSFNEGKAAGIEMSKYDNVKTDGPCATGEVDLVKVTPAFPSPAVQQEPVALTDAEIIASFEKAIDNEVSWKVGDTSYWLRQDELLAWVRTLPLSTPSPKQVAELLELPPKKYLGGDEVFGDTVYGYTEADMEAYARAAIDAAMKEKP